MGTKNNDDGEKEQIQKNIKNDEDTRVKIKGKIKRSDEIHQRKNECNGITSR